MNELLVGLRAAGEPTRLRLIALCAHGEFSVSELVQIVGQSQPRVSRHLKLLVEAGLLMRFREGAQMFFRIAERGDCALLARTLVDLIPSDDAEMNRDLQRLDAVREQRAVAAEAYFREVAPQWDEIRALHVPEQDVNQALLELVKPETGADYLDIGTGTGKILALLADRAERAVGVDNSRPMLNLARANLEKEQLRNAHVRHADMYNLPFEDAVFNLITMHLVLHYAQNPAGAIGEVARVLRPGGRLFIVDFANHDERELSDQHHHAHSGFSDQYLARECRRAGLRCKVARKLVGTPLTTVIWCAVKAA